MRIVLTGTDPLDLRGSFYKEEDLTGQDLSAYDVRFISLADCTARNVILPDNIDYLYSRRTDWSGARIPPLVSSLAHDLVLEVMRHHTAKQGTREYGAIEWVISHVGASYENSWNTAIWHLVNVMGLTRKQVWDYFSVHAFAGYQRLLNRLQSELVGELRSEAPAYSVTELRVRDPRETPKDMKQVYGERIYTLPFSVLRSVKDDIWQAARVGEQHLEDQSGIGGWKVVVFSLEPYTLAVASHESLTQGREVWWSQGLGL